MFPSQIGFSVTVGNPDQATASSIADALRDPVAGFDCVESYGLTRRTVIVPTNCDCARARAKLTVYEALAVERLSYKQRPVIRHWVNPTVGRDLVGLEIARDRTDKRSERLCTSRSWPSAP
jgi:hypothetical protein